MRITKHKKIYISWLDLARDLTRYLNVNTVSGDFKVLNHLKLAKVMIFNIWLHWCKQVEAKQLILIFIEA